MNYPSLFTFDEIFSEEDLLSSNFRDNTSFTNRFLRHNDYDHGFLSMSDKFLIEEIEEEATHLLSRVSIKIKNFDLIKLEFINGEYFFLVNKKEDGTTSLHLICDGLIPKVCTLKEVPLDFFSRFLDYYRIILDSSRKIISIDPPIIKESNFYPLGKIWVIIIRSDKSQPREFRGYTFPAKIELPLDKTIIPLEINFQAGDLFMEEKFPFPKTGEEDAITDAKIYIHSTIENPENEILISVKGGYPISSGSLPIGYDHNNEKLREEYFSILEVSEFILESDYTFFLPNVDISIILKEIVCNNTLLIYRKRYLPF